MKNSGSMEQIFDNPYIMGATKIMLILYASQIAPQAPPMIINLFKNTFVKIALIALLMYVSQYDLQFSIIFAIILVLGMNVASNRSVLESYSNMNHPDEQESYSKDYKPYGNFQLLDPKNEIYPGCLNIKLADLMKMFDDDHYKLQTSVQYAFQQLLNDKSLENIETKQRLLKVAYMAGLPYNLELNDENAPWIATLLVNYKFIVSDTCKQPGY